MVVKKSLNLENGIEKILITTSIYIISFLKIVKGNSTSIYIKSKQTLDSRFKKPIINKISYGKNFNY